MSKANHSLKLLAFIFTFAFFSPFFYANDAEAVAYHAACTKNNTSGNSGTGLDGSDCDSGMICDGDLSVCTLPTEVPCTATTKGSSCPVGMACIDSSTGKILSSTGGNNSYGSCQPYKGASTEDNAISQVLCNVYNFATGKTGRIIIGIIFVGAGATFLLGSMKLGTLLAITIGAAFIFGGPAIVSVLVGKGFVC